MLRRHQTWLSKKKIFQRHWNQTRTCTSHIKLSSSRVLHYDKYAETVQRYLHYSCRNFSLVQLPLSNHYSCFQLRLVLSWPPQFDFVAQSHDIPLDPPLLDPPFFFDFFLTFTQMKDINFDYPKNQVGHYDFRISIIEFDFVPWNFKIISENSLFIIDF